MCACAATAFLSSSSTAVVCACPLCGRTATAEWVERELAKRVGAPHFMVTFTLPAELRRLFFGHGAKAAYDLFFAASSAALRDTLADPKWLGVAHSGFTGILHTWNQLLFFHPHIHYIVPGAGIDAEGHVRTVKSAKFLVPIPVLSKAFRESFLALAERAGLSIHPGVQNINWGINIKPFGSGANAIKYLGAYVCRTAIGDSRIRAITDAEVTFTWKDRANADRIRTETIPGTEFVARYLRHVLPRGMRSIRYFGFCHPAAKTKRQFVAFHTGRPLLVGPFLSETAAPKYLPACPCCQRPMTRIASASARRVHSRGPPALCQAS